MTAAQAKKATITSEGEREVRIERIFDAPRTRVWEAYTNPKLVAQWWGRGHQLDIERMEVERGGHWRYVEHTEHGKQGFEGRYRDVKAPERLVMTFEWDGMPGHVSISTTTFEDLGDGRTKIVVVAQFFTTEERDGMLRSGMEGGLNESYAALDRLLAK